MSQKINGGPIEWTDEKTSRLWDFYSRSPIVEALYFSKVYGHFVLRKARLDRRRPLRLLDFGCGPGYMWDHIQRLRTCWQYTGLDFSSRSVDALEARVPAGSTGFMGAVHATALPSPLPSGHFDVVLLVEVVEHLDDTHLHATLQEAARVLRPGGKVVLSTPNAEDLAIESQFCPECETIFHRWQHVRSWTPASLTDALRPHGFDLDRLWTGHWADYFWYGWVFNRLAKSVMRRRSDPHMFAIFTRR